MTQKQTALQFLTLAAFGKVDEAYDQFVSADFRHHNAHFKGDRESLKRAMKDAAERSPNLEFNVKMALEEGDRVATFSQVKKRDMEIAVTHLFRFAGGKIVEMWDVGMPVPKDCPNENGVF
jgi:predicted SnoaL-like aldol condensation-catalyzing enzyme